MERRTEREGEEVEGERERQKRERRTRLRERLSPILTSFSISPSVIILYIVDPEKRK
jgi:hypothetical protein